MEARSLGSVAVWWLGLGLFGLFVVFGGLRFGSALFFLASFSQLGVPLTGDCAPTPAIVPTRTPFLKPDACTCGACPVVPLVLGWVWVLVVFGCCGFGVFVLVGRWRAPRIQ